MTNGFDNLDATALAALVRDRQASPLELAEDAIRRIEAINPAINAVVHKTYERARARAAAQPPVGAFAGVPWLLKDLSDAKGLPMTLGSRAMRGNVSQVDVPFVAAAEASGLNIVGLTNVPEFGLIESSENTLYGRTRNPWNLEHSAGGSSGGAAAAVAAGIVPMAHGNDGGGSLRIPASHCGLFSLKPSRGRTVVSQAHEYPFDIVYDGVISRSVRDSALFLRVVEDPATPLPRLGPLSEAPGKRLKIGLLLDVGNGVALDPQVALAMADTARLCEDLGHHVEWVGIPFDFRGFADAFLSVWMSLAAMTVEDVATQTGVPPSPEHFEGWTLGLREEALSRGGPAALLAAAAPVIRDGTEKLDAFLSDWDVVLSPVCQGPAPALGQRELTPETSYAQLRQRVEDFAAFTPMHNAAGTPAMSVPLYWDAQGLPIGSQFFARKGHDDVLLTLAFELEQARPWAGRRPARFPA